jgi:hypothetical protein
MKHAQILGSEALINKVVSHQASPQPRLHWPGAVPLAPRKSQL